MLSYNLKSNNFNVLTASNGKDALLKLDSSIELILLDVMMPEMDGFETCKIIKSKPKFLQVSFITK